MAQVHQIMVGTCTEVDDDWCQATCSVTLITDDNFKCLVDCASGYESQKLKDGLLSLNIAPEDVTRVVCTHAHLDHIGNLALFSNAQVLLNDEWSKPGCMYGKASRVSVVNMKHSSDRIQLTPNVWAERMSGHTLCDWVVFAKRTDSKIVCAAGDLFENEDDLKDATIWQANSIDLIAQEKSRTEILKKSDFIIPGHGPMFACK